MSLLIRRIVFVIAAFLLPMQSWTAALASDCAMTINTDAQAHCCKDSRNAAHHSPHGPMHASSTDKQATDQTAASKQATNECLAGANCHCSALYQPVTAFVLIASTGISATEFIETSTHFVAVTHPPLWRPPIAV